MSTSLILPRRIGSDVGYAFFVGCVLQTGLGKQRTPFTAYSGTTIMRQHIIAIGRQEGKDSDPDAISFATMVIYRPDDRDAAEYGLPVDKHVCQRGRINVLSAAARHILLGQPSIVGRRRFCRADPVAPCMVVNGSTSSPLERQIYPEVSFHGRGVVGGLDATIGRWRFVLDMREQTPVTTGFESSQAIDNGRM